MNSHFKSGLIFAAGFSLAWVIDRADIAELKQGHAEYVATQATTRSHALEALLDKQQRDQERADTLATELAVTQGQLLALKQQLKARIDNAVANDGATYTGLGPSGLRLYLETLGYTGDNADVPEASSGRTPRSDATTGSNVRETGGTH